MQNVILKFHPTIQKYTNGLSEHVVKVNDLVDLRNSLEYLFPQLGVHIKRIRCGLNSRENIALVNPSVAVSKISAISPEVIFSSGTDVVKAKA